MCVLVRMIVAVRMFVEVRMPVTAAVIVRVLVRMGVACVTPSIVRVGLPEQKPLKSLPRIS